MSRGGALVQLQANESPQETYLVGPIRGTEADSRTQISICHRFCSSTEPNEYKQCMQTCVLSNGLSNGSDQSIITNPKGVNKFL